MGYDLAPNIAHRGFKLIDLGQKTWDKNRCVVEFAKYLKRRAWDRLGAAMQAMRWLRCWRPCIGQFVGTSPDRELGIALLMFWFTYGLRSIHSGLKNSLPVFVDCRISSDWTHPISSHWDHRPEPLFDPERRIFASPRSRSGRR